MARALIYTLIAVIGLASFVSAVIFLPQGAEKEIMALLMGPLSGICLAIVMHFGNISATFTISFALQNGSISLRINKS